VRQAGGDLLEDGARAEGVEAQAAEFRRQLWQPQALPARLLARPLQQVGRQARFALLALEGDDVLLEKRPHAPAQLQNRLRPLEVHHPLRATLRSRNSRSIVVSSRAALAPSYGV